MTEVLSGHHYPDHGTSSLRVLFEMNILHVDSILGDTWKEQSSTISDVISPLSCTKTQKENHGHFAIRTQDLSLASS
jgi:hypothetical protein